MRWCGTPWIPVDPSNRRFSKFPASARRVKTERTGFAPRRCGENAKAFSGPLQLMRGDPGAAFRCLKTGEHTYIAGDQKTQCVDHVPDPADIGDDRHPLSLRDV